MDLGNGLSLTKEEDGFYLHFVVDGVGEAGIRLDSVGTVAITNVTKAWAEKVYDPAVKVDAPVVDGPIDNLPPVPPAE